MILWQLPACNPEQIGPLTLLTVHGAMGQRVFNVYWKRDFA
jgi:hypothetical protein